VQKNKWTDARTIEEIRKKKLFNDILEATNHAVKFLRMLTLKMENFQIENNEEGSEEENNIIVEENAHYDIQDTTTEEGTDGEEESNEEEWRMKKEEQRGHVKQRNYIDENAYFVFCENLYFEIWLTFISIPNY